MLLKATAEVIPWGYNGLDDTQIVLYYLSKLKTAYWKLLQILHCTNNIAEIIV